MNVAILNGNIGSDLQTTAFKNGGSVTSFSMATNQFYKDKEGERKTVTQWHQIKIYGQLGESAAKHLAKGDKVLIHGAIKYDEFESNGVKKTVAYIDADSFEKQNINKGESAE